MRASPLVCVLVSASLLGSPAGAQVAASAIPLADSSNHPGRFTKSGLWFDDRGSGSPVVLVHGANLDSRSLAALADALRPAHRVILTDLRFHGKSRDDGAAFSFESDLIEVLDAAAVPSAVFVGHSLGATVAIDLALAHPERVTGLVLIGPAYSGQPSKRLPEGLTEMAEVLKRGRADSAGLILGNAPVMRLYRDTASQAAVRRMVMANTALLTASYARVRPLGPPAARRLSELKGPLLAVVGDRDPTEAGDAAEALHSAVAGARLERIQGCGHLTPIDCLPETAALVIRFLR